MCSFFKGSFLLRFYLFLERGWRKRGKHQCVVASHTPPTWDPACNPGMCPDWELNWRPFDSQASSQPLSHTSQGIFLTILPLDLCLVSEVHGDNSMHGGLMPRISSGPASHGLSAPQPDLPPRAATRLTVGMGRLTFCHHLHPWSLGWRL